jgi:hypothetical protein
MYMAIFQRISRLLGYRCDFCHGRLRGRAHAKRDLRPDAPPGLWWVSCPACDRILRYLSASEPGPNTRLRCPGCGASSRLTPCDADPKAWYTPENAAEMQEVCS